MFAQYFPSFRSIRRSMIRWMQRDGGVSSADPDINLDFREMFVKSEPLDMLEESDIEFVEVSQSFWKELFIYPFMHSI